jgi:predicted nucleotidyltransferase
MYPKGAFYFRRAALPGNSKPQKLHETRFKFMRMPNEQAMAVKIAIENLPEELRRKGLEEKLAEICQKNDVVFMAIFGSFVRGEQNKRSDVDIVIEFERNSEKSLLDLVRIENGLRRVFKRKVDVGILSSVNPYIIEEVKREMRIIYEKRGGIP